MLIPGLRTTTDLNEFDSFVYPDHKSGTFDAQNRAILTLRNLEVDKFNHELRDYLKTEGQIFYSSDTLNQDLENAGTQKVILKHETVHSSIILFIINMNN